MYIYDKYTDVGNHRVTLIMFFLICRSCPDYSCYDEISGCCNCMDTGDFRHYFVGGSNLLLLVSFISSPEPLAQWWAYSMSIGPVVVCRLSTVSDISETAGWIEARFHVEPALNGGTKVSLLAPGHMPKTAAIMPIYGKKPSKIFLSRTNGPIFHETWYVALETQAHHSLF